MLKIYLQREKNILNVLLIALILGGFMNACTILQPAQVRQERALCKVSCLKNLKVCKHTCRNTRYDCNKLENASACLMYQHYKHAIVTEGKYLTLQLNSFRDPLQCRKTTCDCLADYLLCKQACHGMVYKQLQAAPIDS